MNREPILEIKQHLAEYLEEHDRKIGRGNVKCVDLASHKNQDARPSATYYEHEESPILYCHTCSRAFDIFDCAYYLEGLPISGQDFYLHNVKSLAERYGVEIPEDDQEVRGRTSTTMLRAYQHATEYIVKCGEDPRVKKLLSDRGISPAHARRWGVGASLGYDHYLNYMRDQGWDEFFLGTADLTRKSIFSDGHLIFSIRNASGKTVAFAGRTDNGSKYVNSSESEIYHKSELLYGLEFAKHTDRVYVVEGYTDAITLNMYGLQGIAICGTAFTKDHIRTLKNKGISTLTFCLDGDEPGQKATREALNIVNAYGSFSEIGVIGLPDDQDPDKFVRTFGIDQFKGLPVTDGFTWFIGRLKRTSKPEMVCVDAIPMIIAQPNHVIRSGMIRSLAVETGVPVDSIRDEIDRLGDIKVEEKRSKLQELRKDLRLSIDDPKFLESPGEVLYKAIEQVNRISRRTGTIVDILEENKDGIQAAKSRCELDVDQHQIKLESRFPCLADALDGFPDRETLISIAGKPHVGKTAYLKNLLLDMVKENEDVIALFMSIDDSRPKIVEALVAIESGLPIRRVHRFKDLKEHEKALWSEGWRKMEKWSERLIIRDSSHGMSIDDFERCVSYLRNKFPEYKLVGAIDNFHLLTDYNDAQRDTDRNAKKSSRLKALSTMYHFPILQTVEVRKGNELDLDSILGTSQVSYDSEVVMFVLNEAASKDIKDVGPENCWYPEGHEADQGYKMPLVKMIVRKNKIGGWHGMLPCELDTHTTAVRETYDIRMKLKERKKDETADR